MELPAIVSSISLSTSIGLTDGVNPSSPAKTTFHAEPCNPITRQAIELESCATLCGFSKSCSRNRKRNLLVFGGGFS